MSKNNRSYTISKLICPECGNKFPIPRLKSQSRERGHIKDVYCPYCNKTQKMLEIRDDDFMPESKQNNWTRQKTKVML